MEYTVKGTAMENYLYTNRITPVEFCKKYQIDYRTYDKIVRGEKVQLTTLFVLAHKIGLSLNDFLA